MTFSRISFDAYCDAPGLNISALKHYRHSPQMFQHRLNHRYETDAMAFGTLAHLLTLEPHRNGEVAIWDRRTEAGAMSPRRGKEWEGFKAANEGKMLVTADQFSEATALADAVYRSTLAQRYMVEGDPEVSLAWKWPIGDCKGRIDWLTRIGGEYVIVGLKTARDCRPFQFGAACAKLGYHLQWAWYHDGFFEMTGKNARMVEIVVESEAPHSVVVYNIPDDVIEQGRQEYQDLCAIHADCTERGEWPGPAESEVSLSLPSWVYGHDGDDVSSLGLEV
jgi:hypothetical protein